MVGMHGNLKGRQKGTPQYAQYSVARLVGTEDLKVSANVLGKCSRIIENSRINGASRYKWRLLNSTCSYYNPRRYVDTDTPCCHPRCSRYSRSPNHAIVPCKIRVAQ